MYELEINKFKVDKWEKKVHGSLAIENYIWCVDIVISLISYLFHVPSLVSINENMLHRHFFFLAQGAEKVF